MSQNPFADNPNNPYADNPYTAPHQNSYDPGKPPTSEMRARSLAKVYIPAILMQVFGVLIIVGSMAILSLPFWAGGDMDEVALFVIFCFVATLGIAAGVFTIVTAQWMKHLKGWGWALASVILSFVFSLLVCPLFFVIGIWPLIVLVDSEVHACFDQKVV